MEKRTFSNKSEAFTIWGERQVFVHKVDGYGCDLEVRVTVGLFQQGELKLQQTYLAEVEFGEYVQQISTAARAEVVASKRRTKEMDEVLPSDEAVDATLRFLNQTVPQLLQATLQQVGLNAFGPVSMDAGRAAMSGWRKK